MLSKRKILGYSKKVQHLEKELSDIEIAKNKLEQ